MKISMNTSYPAKCFGEEEAIRIIARAGFDAFDYTVGDSDDDNPVYGEDYREYVAELAKTAEECQIVCNQAHASFPPRRWGDEEYNQKTFKRIIREMEAAALYMNAARAGKKALAICTVSDSLVTGAALDAEQRQKSFTDMMELALDVAAKIQGK